MPLKRTPAGHSRRSNWKGFNRQDEVDDMVQCDNCATWWHFSCANVDDFVADVDWTSKLCNENGSTEQSAPNLGAILKTTTNSHGIKWASHNDLKWTTRKSRWRDINSSSPIDKIRATVQLRSATIQTEDRRTRKTACWKQMPKNTERDFYLIEHHKNQLQGNQATTVHEKYKKTKHKQKAFEGLYKVFYGLYIGFRVPKKHSQDWKLPSGY